MERVQPPEGMSPLRILQVLDQPFVMKPQPTSDSWFYQYRYVLFHNQQVHDQFVCLSSRPKNMFVIFVVADLHEKKPPFFREASLQRKPEDS